MTFYNYVEPEAINKMTYSQKLNCDAFISYKKEGESQNPICFFHQLRKEKVDLENTLEQEQELLVNRLWKRMDRLEAEKR